MLRYVTSRAAIFLLLACSVLSLVGVAIAVALQTLLMEMPSLANNGSSFRIHHRSSAMSAAPLVTADTASTGPSTLSADTEALPSGSPKQRTAEQPPGSLAGPAPERQPQSSMPVLEASHRGSLILSAYIEPRTGSFRVRPSEEVLQFAEMDYTAVVRVVRRRLYTHAAW